MEVDWELGKKGVKVEMWEVWESVWTVVVKCGEYCGWGCIVRLLSVVVKMEYLVPRFTKLWVPAEPVPPPPSLSLPPSMCLFI